MDIRLYADFSGTGLMWAQKRVQVFHYLRTPVDSRCRPFAYLVFVEPCDEPVGCLIFGRPEATRCYDGALTYGSPKDVADGRAQVDRWEVLNLARVWLSPSVQAGGRWCTSEFVPGFTDRHGAWRPTLASWAIGEALGRVGYDYLRAHSPVDCDYPYQIRAVLSYCDRSLHRGTVYRASGFTLARTNERGIETWYTTAVAPLTSYEDDMIRKFARQSGRSQRIRARRSAAAMSPVQISLFDAPTRSEPFSAPETTPAPQDSAPPPRPTRAARGLPLAAERRGRGAVAGLRRLHEVGREASAGGGMTQPLKAVRRADGKVLRFVERLPKGEAIRQAAAHREGAWK